MTRPPQEYYDQLRANIVHIAQHKRDTTTHKSNQRFYKAEYAEDVTGLMGELAFAERYGLLFDSSSHPNGDGHLDFNLMVGTKSVTIDVKTMTKGLDLLLKVKDAKPGSARIIVACKRDWDNKLRFLGWEWKSKMMLSTPRCHSPRILIPSFHVSLGELQPMKLLDDLFELHYHEMVQIDTCVEGSIPYEA